MRIALYSGIARARFANLQAEIDMGKGGSNRQKEPFQKERNPENSRRLSVNF
jgi:hypothetical protein